MKKMILLIGFAALSIVTITDAKAQKGLQIGLQANPHFSWLNNQNDLDNSSFKSLTTLGGSAGITTQYGLSKNIGLGLDVIYSRQGQRFELNGTERFKQVDYIKAPMLFVYNVEISDRVTFIGKVGPQVGVLANAKLLDKDGGELISDQKAYYQDISVSGVLAMGVGVKLMDYLYVNTLLRGDCSFVSDGKPNYNPNVTRGGITASSSRADTRNITAGLSLGLTLLFD